MATEIYLGNPPANIKKWIEEHAGSAGHPETIFTFQDGTTKPETITGPLNVRWMIDNGYYDDETYEWIKTITQIDIGNTVTGIEESVFNYCTGLASVTIPDSVTSIGDFAFGNCTHLTSMTIPNSVTIIGYGVFDGCLGLTTITVLGKTTA